MLNPSLVFTKRIKLAVENVSTKKYTNACSKKMESLVSNKRGKGLEVAHWHKLGYSE